MEIEADLYLVFTGWNPQSTEHMTLTELFKWHRIAIRRYEKANEDN